MEYFLDTEFMEDGHVIDLLSLALVAEDGRELYVENAEAAIEFANDFVVEHVTPHLGPVEGRISRAAIKRALLDFIGDDPHPVFVSDYASYDWVALCQLFGKMIDLPKGWPMFCLDLQQVLHHEPSLADLLPGRDKPRHHALDDARWLRHAWAAIGADEWPAAYTVGGNP